MIWKPRDVGLVHRVNSIVRFTKRLLKIISHRN